MTVLVPPELGDDWVGLSTLPLPLGVVADWVVRPSCGAVVVFSGTSRDHSGTPGSDDARTEVITLEYEAYDELIVPRLSAIVAALRDCWPPVGAIALLHRTGLVPVGSTSVVVAVSAPHRDEAFAAARFGIDSIKAQLPIWKREVWRGGSAWSLDAHDMAEPAGRDAGDLRARP